MSLRVPPLARRNASATPRPEDRTGTRGASPAGPRARDAGTAPDRWSACPFVLPHRPMLTGTRGRAAVADAGPDRRRSPRLLGQSRGGSARPIVICCSDQSRNVSNELRRLVGAITQCIRTTTLRGQERGPVGPWGQEPPRVLTATYYPGNNSVVWPTRRSVRTYTRARCRQIARHRGGEKEIW